MLILIVDDSTFILALIKDHLSKKGYWVESASDAYGAMVAFVKYKPALVILDYEMPAGSGGDVYERIRGQEGSTAVPVIFLTGRSLSDVRMRVPPGQKVRFLSKPVDFDKLDAAMREFLPGPAKPDNSGRPGA